MIHPKASKDGNNLIFIRKIDFFKLVREEGEKKNEQIFFSPLLVKYCC